LDQQAFRKKRLKALFHEALPMLAVRILHRHETAKS
jgi:hypothetical protein